jgi:hypothetical protein
MNKGAFFLQVDQNRPMVYPGTATTEPNPDQRRDAAKSRAKTREI